MDAVTAFLHQVIDGAVRHEFWASLLVILSPLALGLIGFVALRVGFVLVRSVGRRVASKWHEWHKLGPLAQSIVDTLQNPHLHKTTTQYVVQVWGPPEKGMGKGKLLLEVQPLFYTLRCEIMGTKLDEDSFTRREGKAINNTARKVYKQVNQDSKCGRAGSLNAQLQEAVKNSTL